MQALKDLLRHNDDAAKRLSVRVQQTYDCIAQNGERRHDATDDTLNSDQQRQHLELQESDESIDLINVFLKQMQDAI